MPTIGEAKPLDFKPTTTTTTTTLHTDPPAWRTAGVWCALCMSSLHAPHADDARCQMSYLLPNCQLTHWPLVDILVFMFLPVLNPLVHGQPVKAYQLPMGDHWHANGLTFATDIGLPVVS
jgi:hypothetical protein